MVLLKNKIINHTLTLGFMLIIFLFLSFGIITIKGLVTLGNLTRTIYEHPLVVSNASLNAALYIANMHRGMKDVVLAISLKEIDADLRAVAENEQVVYQQLETIRENILGEEGQELEKQARQHFVSGKAIQDEVIRLLRSGN